MRAGPLTLFFCLALVACGDGGEDGNVQANGSGASKAGEASAERKQSIAEALLASPDHARFVEALRAAGLLETLRSPVGYTVFAPTNAAFEALPEDERSDLAAEGANEARLALLSRHFVPGAVMVADMRRAIEKGPGGRAELATVTGDTLSLAAEGDAVTVGDGEEVRARLVRTDLVQSNGIVHTVDAVLRAGS